MFMSGITIEQIGHIQFEIQSALSGRHQLLVFGSIDDPLTGLPVAGEIHFDVLCVIIFAVLFQNAFCLGGILDII